MGHEPTFGQYRWSSNADFRGKSERFGRRTCFAGAI
jgi:hypothetical protein